MAYCRGPYCIYADRAVEILRANGRRARRLVEDFRNGGRPDSRCRRKAARHTERLALSWSRSNVHAERKSHGHHMPSISIPPGFGTRFERSTRGLRVTP